MTVLPFISVVVCTRNRAEALRTAVDSLCQLKTENRLRFEVLIIDNGSTDATPEIVRQLSEETAGLVRGVVEPEAGIVPARNRGIQEARGTWVAFFDDDQLADEQWLVELLKMATEKQCRCVGGAVRLALPEGTVRELAPTTRMLLGETVGMPAPRLYNDRVTPGCGNMMVQRSVFDEVGLFDPRMSDRGEDTDLFLRMLRSGIAAWYTPSAVIHHVIPAARLSDEYLVRLSVRMARGMAENERKSWGPWRYPLIWAARVAQAALVLAPRWMTALLRGDREAALGARCRLRIAADVVRRGLRLIVSGEDETARTGVC